MAKEERYKAEIKNIGAVMVKKVVGIPPGATVTEAAQKMARFEIGCVAVVDKSNHLIGIFSERDITKKVAARRKNPVTTRVSTVMTTKVTTVTTDDSLVKVARIMQRKHIRHIPVVDRNRNVIGILSMRDLLTRIEANLRGLVKERTKDLNLDALTGLYNYRFFNNYLDAEIARSLRHGHRLSLLFIDVDHFKTFNDTYGHAKGDQLLKELATFLKSSDVKKPEGFSVRKSDLGVRLGGDEFVLILPETPKENALFCAERLRQGIAQKLYFSKKNQPGSGRHVTVSIGIAEFPTDAKSNKELVEKADEALYQAKKRGRNRVYLYA